MAKTDCSELAKNLTQIAMNLASREENPTIDGIVAKMKEYFPLIQRQDLVDAINETTEGQRKAVDEAVKAMNDVKAEARKDKKLQTDIADFQNYVNTGTLPKKRQRPQKDVPEAIQMLKDIADGLKRQIAQSEPARKERMQKSLDVVNKKIASGNIFPKVKEAELRQSAELERLEFEINRKRKQIKQTLINFKPLSKADVIAIPGDLMRAMLSSGDVSAVLGQGAMRFWAHPIKSIKLFPAMFKSVFSDQTASKIYQDIMNRPNAPLYFKSKLGLVPWGEAITLSQREEFFRSTLAERIPVLKHIILGSERAYITFLNLLRADAFDSMAGMTRNGQPTIDEAKDIAYHVNAMTGRGNLGKAELATPLLNAAFYSVKYQVSRFQVLYEPIRIATSRNMSFQVRKAIAKELARSLAGLATIYFLASLGGGDIEDDPRSVDFGKIRYGKLRIDPTAGLARAVVLLARLGTGEKKTEKGQIIPLRGEDATYGQGLGNEIGGFLRSKLSPAFSTPYDIVTGKHFDGTPVTAESLWKKTVIPLSWGEIETNLQEFGGGKASALAVLSIIGMRMNTYGEPIDTMSREKLLEEIDKNTYKTTGYSERDGEKFYHIKGDPHIGKEDLIDRYRQELGNR